MARDPLHHETMANGLKHPMGMTLIEILVVLVIISIALTFAILRMGDFGATRQARQTAESFHHLLSVVRHQSILESVPIGLWINSDGYEVKQLTPLGKWKSSSSQLYKYHRFPSNVIVKVTPHADRFARPNQVFQPSGDAVPMVIFFGSRTERAVKIEIKSNGESTLLEDEG